MSDIDTATFCDRIVKFGLVTPDQLVEAREEAGGRNAELQTLVRTLERKGWLTTYQSTKLLKGDKDGFILGGYRLLYMISAGSFGRVFRSDDPRSGRVVAVKVLRHRWMEDKQKIEAFLREGRVGMTLKHPNIVEILDVGQDPPTKQYYMVMEFVEGGNLREILKIRKTLAVPEALRILEDATAGLTYAYSRGVTHRDIKLTNLLISSQGQAKLVDFGLAQLFASMSKEQGDDPVDRTVDYAGLEKATGVKTGDVRSDIYFLGCVFYEMLTGRPPLNPTKDKNQRMQKRRFQEVEPLRPEEIQAPPSLFLMVETMMALDTHRRYQTPSQLLDAVRHVRRDLEGKDAKSGVAASVFVAEADERLQGPLREKLKGLGYRVFLAADPARALDRFLQQPYDALVVDMASTGEDGLAIFSQVLDEAKRKHVPCVGIAILAQEQSDWAARLPQEPNTAVLVQPGVTLKALHHKLTELLKAE